MKGSRKRRVHPRASEWSAASGQVESRVLFCFGRRGKPKAMRGSEKILAGKRVPLAFRNDGELARCPLFERQE